MTNWIISAEPNMYDYASSFEHHSFIDWRQGRVNFQIGDTIFIYTNRPDSMIQYKCVILDTNLTYPNIRDDKKYFKDPNDYQKSINGKFMRLRLIDQVYNVSLSLDNLMINGLNGPPRGPVKVKRPLFDYIVSNFSDNYQKEIFPELINCEEPFFEGIKKQILVNKYERSSMARKKCMDFHKPICSVCDMNFVQTYGEIGRDFIHIHHRIPIHEIGTKYEINYKEDLIPVCPNCHAMLHRKINDKEPTVDELREMIKHRKP
ncbi:MAG TPA: HNH endonuclease [Mucilaginibacter sp.]|jgi:5-methylcytosine-specific restriction protein A